MDFASVIQANMLTDNPSWHIQIGQRTFSSGDGEAALVSEWELTDDEKDQSQLRVLLANPNMQLSGAFDYDEKMRIRFGYEQEMSPQAHFFVAEVKESYPTDKHMTVEVIGRDPSSKFSGGNNQGNQGKMDDAKRLRQIIESRGMKVNLAATGENAGCKGSCMNEHDRALIYRLGNRLAHSGSSGGGAEPAAPIAKEGTSNIEGSDMKRDAGFTFSSASRLPGNGKAGSRDKNRGQNHKGQQEQAPITAKLELKGFPALRAKTTVAIEGVGPKASGTYYVKQVKHSWKPGRGYRTEADLQRGGTGQGGVGGTTPLVMYCDIWTEGQVYIGPRKINENPQATFKYGDSIHVINFEYTLKPQPNRAGGERNKPSKGAGIDLRKRLEPYIEESKTTASGTGGGQSQSGSSSGTGGGGSGSGISTPAPGGSGGVIQ